VLSPDGAFSVSSFRRSLEGFETKLNEDHILIWNNLCPPKVEVFMWQLLQGRIMVRSVLRSFGFVPGPSVDCVLCKSCEESIDHLFLHCRWTRELWVRCMKFWGVHYWGYFER
jgi:hypothetical protein